MKRKSKSDFEDYCFALDWYRSAYSSGNYPIGAVKLEIRDPLTEITLDNKSEPKIPFYLHAFRYLSTFWRSSSSS